MEKEGIKMETHQNWIKDSKKTQIKANQIWTGHRGGAGGEEVVDGGGGFV